MRLQSIDASSGNGPRLLWLEILLTVIGACLLVWASMLLIDQHLSQYSARQALERQSEPTTAPTLSGNAWPRAVTVGAPIGELSIPRLHLTAIVLHGSDARTLRRGPGHIERTAFPGESGNVAIAGHRDTFFRPIRDIQIGDDVFIDTLEGRYRYRVASMGVVGPTDVNVLAPGASPTLTLITCYPFWVAGPAPNRFVVRATEVERPPIPVRSASPTETALYGSSRGSANEPQQTATTIAADVRPMSRPFSKPPVATNPEVQLRAAVEHFRATYNAQMSRRGVPPGERLLAFEHCDILIAENSATASCLELTEIGAPVVRWVFTLQRHTDAWEVTSVQSP